MPRLTLSRVEEIETAARRLVGALGVDKLDNLEDYARVQALRTLCKQLRAETGVSYWTARQKIAWACRRERHSPTA